MPETPTPPEQESLSVWHIFIEVILCVLAVITAFTIILPLFFIPAAIAFPIIVGRGKLYFIPAAVAGILLLIFFDRAQVLTWFIAYFGVILAILAAFGVGAGFLIRCCRKSRKIIRILATVAGIVILLVPGLYVLDGLSGLVRRPFVNLRIRTYVARNYSDFDLTVNRPIFDFKGGYFGALVHDSNNPDISFLVSHRNGRISDGFTAGTFWAGTLEYLLPPLLEEEFSGEFSREVPRTAWVSDGFTARVVGVQVGQPFDKTADVEKIARIIVTTESAAPEALAAKISRYHEFISQNGFNFARYRFHFRYENAPPIRVNDRVIEITVISELINDDLPAMIGYARGERSQDGVFDREYFRYVSLVDFTPD